MQGRHLFDWFRAFNEDFGWGIGSQSQGVVLQKRFYTPLQAQLALVTGDPSSDVDSIKNFHQKIDAGITVECSCCNGVLWSKILILDKGHQKGCNIVEQAALILAQAPIKFSERDTAFKAERAEREKRKRCQQGRSL